MDVVFVDNEQTAKGAVDGGGPTREYLRLLMKDLRQTKDRPLTLMVISHVFHLCVEM